MKWTIWNCVKKINDPKYIGGIINFDGAFECFVVIVLSQIYLSGLF